MTGVVQVIQHLRPGGIETLVLAIADADPTMTVISLEGRSDDLIAAWPRAAALGARLIGLQKQPGTRPGLLRHLVGLFRRLRPTAVHTHHIGPLIYGGLAARLAGVPRVIHTEHDAWHLERPGRRRLEGLMLRLVQPTLVADAGPVAAALRRAFSTAHPQLIYNGVDTDRFRPGDVAAARARLGLPIGVPIIGCAARLEPVKGVDRVIEAMPAVPPPAILALAGEGSERARLETLVQSLNLVDRVRFLGRVDEMATFYRALDLFCLASRAEGLPLSPLEAQACGVPAVLTAVGGMGEALCPTTGRLVSAAEPAALPAALAAALTTSLAAEGAGETARGWVDRERGLQGMLDAYRRLYAA